MTISVDGGMIGPSVAAAEHRAAPKPPPYPVLVNSGTKIRDSAAQSATDEPEMPERNTSPTTAVCATPPRIWPMSARVKPNSRSLMPESFINAPASVNRGMASNGKDWTPVTTRCATTDSGNPSSPITSSEEPSMAREIGSPISSRAIKESARAIIPTLPRSPHS